MGEVVAPVVVAFTGVQVAATGSTVAVAQVLPAGPVGPPVVVKVVVTATELPLVPPQLVVTLTV
jgi:hypothetical protein